MGDLIDQDAALEIVKRTSGDYAAAWSMIHNLPAVDAEPVRHAYWIGSDAYGDADGFPVYDTFECSECHDWYDNCDGTPPPHNYCPNCGAKMDGGINNA